MCGRCSRVAMLHAGWTMHAPAWDGDFGDFGDTLPVRRFPAIPVRPGTAGSSRGRSVSQSYGRSTTGTTLDPGLPRVDPSLPRSGGGYHGLPRTTTVHLGLPGSTGGYHGLPRCTPVHPGPP